MRMPSHRLTYSIAYAKGRKSMRIFYALLFPNRVQWMEDKRVDRAGGIRCQRQLRLRIIRDRVMCDTAPIDRAAVKEAFDAATVNGKAKIKSCAASAKRRLHASER